MTWTGFFFGGIGELFGGVEGYFGNAGVGSVGQIPTVVDAVTTIQVSFRAPNYLGRINFFGTDLTIANTTLSNGTVFPVFTSGTITGIEYLHNYTLQRALEQGISDASLNNPALLEPSSALQLPNVAAAAMSAAIVQAYNSGSLDPIRNFFSSDSHVYVGSDNTNNLAGWNQNDTLIGNGGGDLLAGNGGNDVLDGGPGTDGLDGGEGSDLHLPGPPGNTPTGDSIRDSGRGQGDIDTLSYANAPGAVVIDLNEQDGDQSAGWARGAVVSGIERVVGSNFDDVIHGSAGSVNIVTADDILEGGLGDDTLLGHAGNDVLQGGPGFDLLFGDNQPGVPVGLGPYGPGSRDVARFAASSGEIDVFFPGDGSVLVAAPGGGIDRLFDIEFIGLTDGVFSIGAFGPSQRTPEVGDDTAETIRGGNGPDLLFGRGGNDTLLGNGGNDRLEGDQGDDVLDGGAGADTMFGGSGNDTYIVNDSGDLAIDTAGDAGADTVISILDYALGMALENLILDGNANLNGTGNARANRIEGNAGANRIDGAEGDDVLLGHAGNDIIIGGTGADFIGGGEGDDVINGIAGQNRIFTGLGRDTVNGGSDGDEIQGAGPGANRLLGNGGDDTIRASDGGDLIGGGSGNDTLLGADGRDTIYGGADNDFIGGGAGNDMIFGSSGLNTIYTGLGLDTVQGGSGTDSIYGGGTVTNQMFGNGGADQIVGGSGNDLIGGGANDDALYGSVGNDTIYAGSGNDFVGAGVGNDLIVAGAGNNRIYGGAGNDTVVAGVGRDVVTGGPDADVFVFSTVAQIGIGAGRDTVTDFTSGVDRIDLSALNMTFVGGAAFSGRAGELRYIPGFVVGDVNGDGINDFAIELSGAPALTAGDFIL